MECILRVFTSGKLGMLGVICLLFIVRAEICQAKDTTLETVLRGIEYNDSLLKGVKGAFIVKSQMDSVQPPPSREGTVIKLMPNKRIDKVFYALDYVKQRMRKNVETFRDDGTGILGEEKKFDSRQEVFDGEKGIDFFGSQLQIINGKHTRREVLDPESFGLTFTPQHIRHLWGQVLRTMAVEVKGTEAINGSFCYLLEFTYSAGREKQIPKKVKVWVNPQNGYRVERVLTQSNNRYIELYDMEYRVFPDGARFPIRGRRRYFSINPDGTPEEYRSCVMAVDESVQKLEVNGSFSDSLFVFDPPEGTTIIDLRTGIGYKKGKETEIYLIDSHLIAPSLGKKK